ncbi:MAG TPA: hypothetical protein VGG25_17785 [Streptosporangiaceae bacterium]|jgi:hypothetical protein
MRLLLACAGALACTPGLLAVPSVTAAPVAPAGATLTGHFLAQRSAPATGITVNGSGGNRVFDGVGAVLGGGGNARYLMDYPARQRDQILDYLFKPDYGASLQILKLEIGGDANSSDGAEPSIEHTRGQVNCRAGYELSIAKAAVARNPALRLYGLQWAAPGWVRSATARQFTGNDIRYLLNWLGCTRKLGLTVGYLGGWNEADTGTHRAWFARLRRALNDHGYRRVRIVAADSRGRGEWHYVGDKNVAILGAHDSCGGQTGAAGPATTCDSPWSLDGDKDPSSQPMWGSELGGMDAGAQPGCRKPCAPGMDRGVIRGYVDARLTGFLEWPVLDAMPPGLPYENRGLVTAGQPWSGSYRVNAMTWAIAQLTQFARPQSGTERWQFLTSASGLLQGDRADGSYITLVRHHRASRPARWQRRGTAWSTIIEATTATATQRAMFRVTGGRRLAGKTVHVWASDFDQATSGPGSWFVRQPDIHPAASGQFTLTIQPGWVYSLTTTTGQRRGSAAGRPPAAFALPATQTLGGSGRAGRADDEPPDLAAQDGAFELARCRVPAGRQRTCTEQVAATDPVYWHDRGGKARWHFPYAVIGSPNWANYAVSVKVLMAGKRSSAGLIGRFGCQTGVPNPGQFDGYLFDVTRAGAWRLTRNANRAAHRVAGCEGGPSVASTLGSGHLKRPLSTRRWYRLTLAMSGSRITASVNGTAVASASDSAWTAGLAGIEAGAGTRTWPHVQYSDLAVTRQPS